MEDGQGRTSVGALQMLGSVVSGTAAIRVIETGALFVIAVVLAWMLTAQEFGIYMYAIACVELLLVAGGLGLPTLLQREVAVMVERRQWGHLRGLLRRADEMGVLVACLLAGGVAGVAWMYRAHAEAIVFPAFGLAMMLTPMRVLVRLRETRLLGLHHTWKALIAPAIVYPAILILLLLALWFMNGSGVRADQALIANLAATLLLVFMISVLAAESTPEPVKAVTPVFRTRTWVRSAILLAFVYMVVLLNTRIDLIMLGWIRGPEEAGVYAMAVRIAGLMQISVSSVLPSLGPLMAGLVAAGHHARLQEAVWRGGRMVALLAAVLFVLLAGAGPLLLRLMGAEFTAAYWPLVILAVAQFYNAVTGVLGSLLVVSHNEGAVVRILVIGSIVNVSLNAAMIPNWGMVGGAVATAVALAVTSFGYGLSAHRRVGIRLCK